MTCARLSVRSHRVARSHGQAHMPLPCQKAPKCQSSPHAAPPGATQCLDSFPKGSRGAHRTSAVPVLPLVAVPHIAHQRPAPTNPREKEGEPCRVWEAIESIPGRLAPCRVENGGGRGNCSVKLGRVNMHVGSRSAAIGLDHARSPVPSKKSVLDKRHAPEKGGRREEGGRKA